MANVSLQENPRKRFTRTQIREYNQRCRKRAKAKGSIPTWIRGQRTEDQPIQFLSLEECKSLRSKGWGDFINRSKGFRRWDISSLTEDQEQDKRRANGGLKSLKVDERMMIAYVDGSALAEAAVHSWA